MSELNDLRREVASLRDELRAMRAMLGLSEAANENTDEPLPHLRCASLSVVGPGSEDGEPRFGVKLSIGEDGGALHLTDELAGETRVRATLSLTALGATLALCGEDGVPRLVAQSRLEGGGVSFLGQEHDLAAEVWGAEEASWMALYHKGRPAVMTVALQGGGTLEAFDSKGEFQSALPTSREEVFPPPATV
jgi:hypothetical protein